MSRGLLLPSIQFMPKKELEQFLYKVDQLQKMVNSLDEIPDRRNLLEACKSHDEVVTLAKSWGFEIGRRWGE